jgi:hypothetical protein
MQPKTYQNKLMRKANLVYKRRDVDSTHSNIWGKHAVIGWAINYHILQLIDLFINL